MTNVPISTPDLDAVVRSRQKSEFNSNLSTATDSTVTLGKWRYGTGAVLCGKYQVQSNEAAPISTAVDSSAESIHSQPHYSSKDGLQIMSQNLKWKMAQTVLNFVFIRPPLQALRLLRLVHCVQRPLERIDQLARLLKPNAEPNQISFNTPLCSLRKN